LSLFAQVKADAEPGALGTAFTNTVTVDDRDPQPDPTPDNNRATDTDTLVPPTPGLAPDYVISKDDSQTEVRPNQPLTYQVTVRNVGGDGTDVVITDTYPLTALTEVTASHGGVVDTVAGTVTWRLPLFKAGESQTFTVNAVVGATAPNKIINTVAVEDSDPRLDPTPDNNRASDTDTLLPLTPDAVPDYVISKDDQQTQVAQGQVIQYQIRVFNQGGAGQEVVISDRYPLTQLEILGISPQGTVDRVNGLIQWTLPTLGAGESQVFTVTAKVITTQTGGSLTNTVSVDDRDPRLDPTPNNNQAVDINTLIPPLSDSPVGTDEGTAVTPTEPSTPAPADFTVTKSDGVTQAEPGQTLTYQITVSNVGGSSGTVLVVDEYPAALLTVSSVSEGGAIQDGKVVWTLDSLAAGSSRTVTLTAQVNPQLDPALLASFSNQVQVTPSGIGALPDPTPDNNRASDTDALVAKPVTPPQPFQSGDVPPVNDSFVYYYYEHEVSRDYVEEYGDRFWLFDWHDIQFKLPPLPVAPIFSGLVAPGTAVTLHLYDEQGVPLGSNMVMADTGGNWLMTFPNLVLWDNPHSVEVQQLPALYNHNDMSVFDMRTYFVPAINSQLFFSHTLSVNPIFAFAPAKILAALHEAYERPFAINWDNFNAYEFVTGSTTTTQSTM